MDKVQSEFAKTLSKAIRGQELKLEYSSDFYEEVLDEAKAHHVHTMLYPLLKDGLKSDTKWKGIVHSTAIHQGIKMDGLMEVFQAFKQNKISYIGLKGVYLQYLYPVAQMRIMSDVDLLVHQKDLGLITLVLCRLGYQKKCSASTATVTVFEHAIRVTLEIHHRLFDNHQFEKTEELEKKIWENQMKERCLERELYFPAPTLHCHYMLLHMAKHFIFSGFGLRQLADFVLLVEHCGIDPLLLIEEMKVYKVQRFAWMLLLAGNRVLNLELPETLLNISGEDVVYLEYFIQEIIKDGVFGKKSRQQIAQQIISNHQGSYRKLFLPAKVDLKSRYWYVTKIPALLPIAWLHRIFYNIFLRKDLGIHDKWHIIKAKDHRVSNRQEVLKWLSLMR